MTTAGDHFGSNSVWHYGCALHTWCNHGAVLTAAQSRQHNQGGMINEVDSLWSSAITVVQFWQRGTAAQWWWSNHGVGRTWYHGSKFMSCTITFTITQKNGGLRWHHPVGAITAVHSRQSDFGRAIPEITEKALIRIRGPLRWTWSGLWSQWRGGSIC